MTDTKAKQKIIIVGGGIGGLAAALALTRQGIQVLLLEQAEHIGEIGAGIQLGPNAFNALDALGAGEATRNRAVFTDHLIMMDAVDGNEVVRIETDEKFRERFGGPYGVIHRADIHLSILEAVQHDPLIEFKTSTHVADVKLKSDGVEVSDTNGNVYHADAVVGCDGVKSVIREKTIGRHHRVTGHVVYRAVVDLENMPEDLRVNAPMLWAGPRCHLVHYPLRGGQQYNLVVTFHSRDEEEWGVTDGSKEEVMSYFEGVHPRPLQMLDRPTSWRRWATADADPGLDDKEPQTDGHQNARADERQAHDRVMKSRHDRHRTGQQRRDRHERRVAAKNHRDQRIGEHQHPQRGQNLFQVVAVIQAADDQPLDNQTI
ncbi:salicylate hydroxylase [Eoetvoesiella caeni]|uniref:Salicylate hydroxylase n=1 Tax=Eoetvoesiella caeni TaxID=645616 RepID=A0A366H0T9_9BURK|nr:salicylate hydroxylase [Eoetvoesiella caeni]